MHGKNPGRILLSILSLLLLLSITACGGGEDEGADSGPEFEATPLPVARAGEEVVAEGEVIPVESAELEFKMVGMVTEILVEEGSVVKEGDPLVRLDSRNLMLNVEEAEAALEEAKASYDRLAEGATPEEIAVAEASVRIYEQLLKDAEANVGSAEAGVVSAQADVARAQGQYQEIEGSVTESDIAAAQAKVERYRVELARLESGPKATDRQQAKANLDRAIANLKEVRDQLSANKTEAYWNMQAMANNLRDLQQNYSGIYWENRETERNWDSPEANVDQHLRDREDSALRAVKSAEAELEMARNLYDKAKKNEETGIAAAEARVKEAEANYTEVIDPAEPEEVARVRASLSEAEAQLAALQGQKRSGQLSAAAAGIQSAQANVGQAQSNLNKTQTGVEKAKADLDKAKADLDKVLADTPKSDLDASLAKVKRQEVYLKKAQLELDNATLEAPIDGTVVEVNPKVGERFNTTDLAVVIADLSEWKIETTDLDELEIVSVREGSLVRISFDALPDLELPGTVTDIQEYGKNYQGDIVYKVTIKPDQWDDRLRWRMTSTVAIEPIQADEVTPTATPEEAEDAIPTEESASTTDN
jgi:HlyD family secretion protein